ncbi:MAG: nucleotidyl transferase AbiEii/AbiGii toxin family protein [Actinomycetota bacterium]
MKKNISKLCLDLLKPQEKILFRLSPIFARKGILAGGTSLMLQLGHRKSFDLDFFFLFNPQAFLKDALRHVRVRYASRYWRIIQMNLQSIYMKKIRSLLF